MVKRQKCSAGDEQAELTSNDAEKEKIGTSIAEADFVQFTNIEANNCASSQPTRVSE